MHCTGAFGFTLWMMKLLIFPLLASVSLSCNQCYETAPEDEARRADAIAIAAGGHHTCAIDKAGKVVCWGHNRRCQTNVPAGFEAAVAVAAGLSHTCANDKAGKVVCRGYSDETEQTYYSTGIRLMKKSRALASQNARRNTPGVTKSLKNRTQFRRTKRL